MKKVPWYLKFLFTISFLSNTHSANSWKDYQKLNFDTHILSTYYDHFEKNFKLTYYKNRLTGLESVINEKKDLIKSYYKLPNPTIEIEHYKNKLLENQSKKLNKKFFTLLPVYKSEVDKLNTIDKEKFNRFLKSTLNKIEDLNGDKENIKNLEAFLFETNLEDLKNKAKEFYLSNPKLIQHYKIELYRLLKYELTKFIDLKTNKELDKAKDTLENFCDKKKFTDLKNKAKEISDYVGKIESNKNSDYLNVACKLFDIKIKKDPLIKEIKNNKKELEKIVKRYGKIDLRNASSRLQNLRESLKDEWELEINHKNFYHLVKLVKEQGIIPVIEIGKNKIPLYCISEILVANDVENIRLNPEILRGITEEKNVIKKIKNINSSLGKEVISLQKIEKIVNEALFLLASPQINDKNWRDWERDVCFSNQYVNWGFANYITSSFWYELALPELFKMRPLGYIGKTDISFNVFPLAGIEGKVKGEIISGGVMLIKDLGLFTTKLTLGISSIQKGNAQLFSGFDKKYLLMDKDLQGFKFPSSSFEFGVIFPHFTFMTHFYPKIKIKEKIYPGIYPVYSILLNIPLQISYNPLTHSYSCSASFKF